MKGPEFAFVLVDLTFDFVDLASDCADLTFDLADLAFGLALDLEDLTFDLALNYDGQTVVPASGFVATALDLVPPFVLAFDFASDPFVQAIVPFGPAFGPFVLALDFVATAPAFDPAVLPYHSFDLEIVLSW